MTTMEPETSPRRTRLLVVAAIALGAAACFWPTMTRTLEWMDEGQLVYPGWRVARGELAYRDFHHFYMPSHSALNGALLSLFGEDLRVLRLGLLVVKAALVALVFLVGRAAARGWIALGAAAWLLALWSAPLWLYATPYGSYYTLACDLAGLALLVHRPGSAAVAVAAGLCFGLGATFKQTTGLLCAVGAVVALAGIPGPPGARDRLAGAARLLRGLVMVAAAVAALAYPARPLGFWTVATLAAAPFLALAAEAARAWSDEQALAAGYPRLVRTLGFGAGFVLPLAVWAGVYARAGALSDLVHDAVVGLPQRVAWFIPFDAPGPPTLALGAALALGAVGLATRRTVVLALAALAVVPMLAAAMWLPGWNPVTVEIERFLPLALVWASAPLALGPIGSSATRLLWWFGAFACLTLSPCTDFLHALLLLPAVVPMIALVLEWAWASAGRQPLAQGLVAVLAAGALFLPARHALVATAATLAAASGPVASFRRATGIHDPHPRWSDIQEVLGRLDAFLPPGAPILVLPSAQLVYFLADRPSALQQAEIVLYFVTVGVMRPEDARALAPEEDMLRRLRETRPPIVRARDTGWQRIAATFPALDAWIRTHYVVTDVIGTEELLRPRDDAGAG